MKLRISVIILCGLVGMGCKTYQSVLSPGTEGIDSVTLSRLVVGKSYQVLLATDSLIEVKVLAADYQQLTCQTRYVDSNTLKSSKVVAQGEEVISSQSPGPTVLRRESIKDVRELKTSFPETKKNIGLTVGLALILGIWILVDNYIKSTF